jgi:hypothetical protein
LEALREEIERDISERAEDVLEKFPVDQYLSFFDELSEFANYSSMPSKAASFCDAIAARTDAETLEAYLRLAMVILIAERTASLPERLTAETSELLLRYLDRVVKAIRSPRRGFYVHTNDQFVKDFAVCRGKLLPCDVELIDRCSGVPRRTLLRAGARQLVSTLAFHAKMGGFRPFYELHFDRRSIRSFNEEGYVAMYLRIADMLVLNPEVKGLMSSSWWHDPRVAEVSPELAFIDRHPKSAGARLLFVEESERVTVDAIRFSERRATLHSQGLYQPRVYMLVWARRDILAWAERYRTQHSGCAGETDLHEEKVA